MEFGPWIAKSGIKLRVQVLYSPGFRNPKSRVQVQPMFYDMHKQFPISPTDLRENFTFKELSKTAVDNANIVYSFLSKKVMLDISCESTA